MPVAGSKVSPGRSVVRLGGEEPACWLCRRGMVDRRIALGASDVSCSTYQCRSVRRNWARSGGQNPLCRLSHKVAFLGCWQVHFIDINLFIQVFMQN